MIAFTEPGCFRQFHGFGDCCQKNASAPAHVANEIPSSERSNHSFARRRVGFTKFPARGVAYVAWPELSPIQQT